MKMIQNKVEHMSVWEKHAVLIFDEMSIKSSLDYDSKRDVIEGLYDFGEDSRKAYPATHVLLFMVRGLMCRWKMPIAYYATNKLANASVISKTVTKVIEALQAAGINIRAVVCDQSSVNRKAAKLLNTSICDPFFNINGQKIYFVYDICHVIKCIRNNLMKTKHNRNVGQMAFEKSTNSFAAVKEDCENGSNANKVEETAVADWTHVVMLYDIDSRATKSRATKLTEKHIRPNNFEKMSVKLATQVFSHSVSAAMRTAVETGELPSSALDTAFFIQRLNNLFDVMNSKTKVSPNPYNCAITTSNNSHLKTPLETLMNDIEWVKTLRMVNNATQPPCLQSIQQTLTAAKLLWDDFKADGAKYFMTSRINQDPIVNEFSVSRQKCGFERNPSVRLFRQNLRHRIQAALILPPAGGNCQPDEDELLSRMETNKTPDESSPATTPHINPEEEEEEEDIPVTTDSDSDLDDVEDVGDDLDSSNISLETCSIRYFTGYGVRSCLNKFKCPDCNRDLLKLPLYDELASPEESLIRNKEYQEESHHLLYPTDEATGVVNLVLVALDEILKKKIHINGFLKKVKRKAEYKIFKQFPNWFRVGDECYKHRQFIVKQILVAKLKRTLQGMSKDLRQPGGKYGGYWQKTMNLKNN